MAHVDFKPINWENYMPHYNNMEFKESEDSEWMRGLQDIRDNLFGTFGTRSLSSRELAYQVSEASTQLRNIELAQGPVQSTGVLAPKFSPSDVENLSLSEEALKLVYGEIPFNTEEVFSLDKQISFSQDNQFSHALKVSFTKEVLSDIVSSQIFEKKVKFSQKTPKQEKIVNKNEEKHEEFNYSISALLTQMPLFYENMFTAFFTVSDGAFDDFYAIGDTTTSLVNRDRYQHVMDCFGVNLSEFEVPQPKSQTYTVKFLDREIKKVASSYELPHRVELSFDVDQMGMLIQNFQILSYGGQGNNTSLELTPVEANKYYAQQFFPAVFKDRSKVIKLYVLFNNMSEHYGNVIQTKNKNGDIRNGRNQVIGTAGSYKAFIFENVQFLGITSNLDFNRDSATSLKLNAAFRFQTLKEFDNNRIN